MINNTILAYLYYYVEKLSITKIKSHYRTFDLVGIIEHKNFQLSMGLCSVCDLALQTQESKMLLLISSQIPTTRNYVYMFTSYPQKNTGHRDLVFMYGKKKEKKRRKKTRKEVSCEFQTT